MLVVEIVVRGSDTGQICRRDLPLAVVPAQGWPSSFLSLVEPSVCRLLPTDMINAEDGDSDGSEQVMIYTSNAVVVYQFSRTGFSLFSMLRHVD